MPLSFFTVKRTDSEQGIEIDVNDILQVDFEPITQEIEIEIEHIPCCLFSFKAILQVVGIIFSSVFSVLSIVFSFITGRF